MVNEAGKPVHFILNKVDEDSAAKMMAKLGKERVVGVIPFSKPVQEKGLTGEPLDLSLPSMAGVTSFVLRALQRSPST
jgi:CO dehydrogenase nickel-insertion accessory protein CooC1